MKQIITLMAALCISSMTSLAQFEGVVRMVAVTHTDEDSSIVRSTVYFKGKLLAAVLETADSVNEQGGKFILRGDRNLMWIVLDEERKVIEIPIGDSAGGVLSDSSSRRVPLEKSYTLKRTGATSTLTGYLCEEWLADEGEGKTARIWATRDLANMYEGVVRWFDEMSMASATDKDRWERELADKNLFPLRIVRSDEGVVTESEDVVSVEKRTIPASTFEVPEGYQYQKIDLNFEQMFDEMLNNIEIDSTDGDADPDDGDG